MPILNNLTVNEITDGPEYYIGLTKAQLNQEIQNDTSATKTINFTALGATDVSSFALAYAYSKCRSLHTVDMSIITRLSGTYCCYGAYSGSGVNSLDLSNLTVVAGQYAAGNMASLAYPSGGTLTYNLSKLESITGNYGCTGMFHAANVTGVDLPALTSISGSYACYSMFSDNPTLTTMNMKNLTTVTGNSVFSEFLRGAAITVAKFESLSVASGSLVFINTFQNCTSLQSLYFYALSSFGGNTNQFNNMLNGCSNVTVHFPMAIQSTIGSWSSVTGGFGGTNTTVLFDIVTSAVGADTNTYQRQEKDSTSTATAWTYNDTLYYTSGNAEPQVGDTIYSDSACTTAVTTISSIA